MAILQPRPRISQYEINEIESWADRTKTTYALFSRSSDCSGAYATPSLPEPNFMVVGTCDENYRQILLGCLGLLLLLRHIAINALGWHSGGRWWCKLRLGELQAERQSSGVRTALVSRSGPRQRPRATPPSKFADHIWVDAVTFRLLKSGLRI